MKMKIIDNLLDLVDWITDKGVSATERIYKFLMKDISLSKRRFKYSEGDEILTSDCLKDYEDGD